LLRGICECHHRFGEILGEVLFASQAGVTHRYDSVDLGLSLVLLSTHDLLKRLHNRWKESYNRALAVVSKIADKAAS
jgi:hypothetical protein